MEVHNIGEDPTSVRRKRIDNECEIHRSKTSEWKPRHDVFVVVLKVDNYLAGDILVVEYSITHTNFLLSFL